MVVVRKVGWFKKIEECHAMGVSGCICWNLWNPHIMGVVCHSECFPSASKLFLPFEALYSPDLEQW